MQAFDPNTEIIDGYEVSSKMKGLWNIEVEILQKFTEVCKKYHLRWYAIGGTLLGAVRHKGFIPWDDDMDVAMPPDDYETLCKVAETEFQYPYFFQYHKTDPYALPWQIKIRRSDTTGYTLWEDEFTPDGFNKGIFIDVFPLHDIPDNEKTRVRVFKQLTFIQKKIKFKRRTEGRPERMEARKKGGIKTRLHDLLFIQLIDYNRLSDWYLKLCSKRYNSAQFGLVAFDPNNKTLQWPKAWFEEIIQLDFGNLKINAPKEYDKVLSVEYGDYMKPVKGTQYHSELIVDTGKPYLQYLQEKEFCNQGDQ